MNQDDFPSTLDPYRLPRHVVPIRYDLRLEPDLPAQRFLDRRRSRSQSSIRRLTSFSTPLNSTIVSARSQGDSEAANQGKPRRAMNWIKRRNAAPSRFPGLSSPAPGSCMLTFRGDAQRQAPRLLSEYLQRRAAGRRKWPPHSSKPPMPVGPSPAGTNRILKPSLPPHWSSIPCSPRVSNSVGRIRNAGWWEESGPLRRYDQDVHLPGRIHRRPDRADRTGDDRQDPASPVDRSREDNTRRNLVKTLRRRHSHFLRSYYGIPYPGDKLDLLPFLTLPPGPWKTWAHYLP